MIRKTFGSVIANAFCKLLIGVIAAAVVGVVFFYIAAPKLKAVIEGIGQ